MAEGQAVQVVDEVIALSGRLQAVTIRTIDGLRVELERGWGLVRASNTQPGLVFRFEADDQQSFEKAQTIIRELLERVALDLQLPF
jgi:phosphomannomutase/phosphoglucomutase